MELNFHPKMTLLAAARIAHEHGKELYVKWDGQVCRITTIPAEHEYIPPFLLKQAD